MNSNLGDGQKISQWNFCSNYLELSDVNSSLEGYAFIFSWSCLASISIRVFEIVFGTGNDTFLDGICCQLFNFDHDFSLQDDDFTSDEPSVYCLPPFDIVWLNDPECNNCCIELHKHCHFYEYQ